MFQRLFLACAVRGRDGGRTESCGGDVQLVDVGVEDAVYETYARALVGILVGELDVDFPKTTGERRWRAVHGQMMLVSWGNDGDRTLFGTFETDVEFLPSPRYQYST